MYFFLTRYIVHSFAINIYRCEKILLGSEIICVDKYNIFTVVKISSRADIIVKVPTKKFEMRGPYELYKLRRFLLF